MGRIAVVDIVIAGLLALFMVLAVLVATAFVFFVALELSQADYFWFFAITISVFFLAGGIVLGTTSGRAGYPILRTWLQGAVIILGIFGALSVVGGLVVSVDVLKWLGLMASMLLLALFFVIGLAGFLDARYAGAPTQKFIGTKPAGWSAAAPIYKSNNPVIYQGIRELDFDNRAPGSLYRRRQ